MAADHAPLLVGKWLPSQRDLVLKWLKKEINKFQVEQSRKHNVLKDYFPDTNNKDEILLEFYRNVPNMEGIAKDLELTDQMKALFNAMGTEPEVGMMIIEMFRQQPNDVGAPICLLMINNWCRHAPPYIDESLGINIPVPLGCILTYAMATPAGFAGFVNERINSLFKDILNDYGNYLQSPQSTEVLDDSPGGWFSPKALQAMDDFDNTYICNPEAPHRGYQSFDDFFTRQFREGVRPVAEPENDYVVVNACENAPYRISHNVQRHEAFWIKSQPYSLQYILNNDEYTDRFVGGTIYQGFLGPQTYHRFHAPISGKILRKEVISGKYFSHPHYTDGSSNYMTSQPYLAHVASRGIVIIESDNKDLGLVAFVPIGMVEVSTIDFSPLNDVNYVRKGDSVGTFHFGGSSHLIIFEKKAKDLVFDLQGQIPGPGSKKFLNVRSKLATMITPGY